MSFRLCQVKYLVPSRGFEPLKSSGPKPDAFTNLTTRAIFNLEPEVGIEPTSHPYKGCLLPLKYSGLNKFFSFFYHTSNIIYLVLCEMNFSIMYIQLLYISINYSSRK